MKAGLGRVDKMSPRRRAVVSGSDDHLRVQASREQAHESGPEAQLLELLFLVIESEPAHVQDVEGGQGAQDGVGIHEQDVCVDLAVAGICVAVDEGGHLGLRWLGARKQVRRGQHVLYAEMSEIGGGLGQEGAWVVVVGAVLDAVGEPVVDGDAVEVDVVVSGHGLEEGEERGDFSEVEMLGVEDWESLFA